MVLKPYCFKWVLAYRMKQLYLLAFSPIMNHFAMLAYRLQYRQEGEEVTMTVERAMEEGFKPLKLV